MAFPPMFYRGLWFSATVFRFRPFLHEVRGFGKRQRLCFFAVINGFWLLLIAVYGGFCFLPSQDQPLPNWSACFGDMKELLVILFNLILNDDILLWINLREIFMLEMNFQILENLCKIYVLNFSEILLLPIPSWEQVVLFVL